MDLNIVKTGLGIIMVGLIGLSATRLMKRDQVIKKAANLIGTPYCYGGESLEGIDCSAFTKRVFNAVGQTLPRTAAQQYASTYRTYLPKAGDLIFFAIDSNKINHVGIVLDQNRMIHAGSSQGVIIESYKKPYWKKYFVGFTNPFP